MSFEGTAKATLFGLAVMTVTWLAIGPSEATTPPKVEQITAPVIHNNNKMYIIHDRVFGSDHIVDNVRGKYARLLGN